jgi:GNAT superfamily N-acetyltransferase
MQNRNKIKIVCLEQLPIKDLVPLVEESYQQGHEFLDRLISEYADGTNQFKKPGEGLFGVYFDQQLVAIGGLNRDPYLSEPDIGRVRHLYVLSAWRKQGIGKQLVQAIIAAAKGRFRLLTLRTFSADADGFYRAIGFQTKPEIDGATHHLILKEY